MTTTRPRLSEEALLERIHDVGGLDEDDAARALRATLAVLAERMPERERGAFADALPERWEKVVRAPGAEVDFDLDAFYARVRRRERTTAGFAREHAQTIGRVLAELLPAETRAGLERALPASFAELLRPRDAAPPPPDHPATRDPRRHTLATAKPGFAHPVSESRPPGAQEHSVVREDNPHSDRKLSSAG